MPPFAASLASPSSSSFLLTDSPASASRPARAAVFFTDAGVPTPADPWRASRWWAAARRLSRRWHAAKFIFRGLTQPRLTTAWLARLEQPDLVILSTARPRLSTKLQRPYVSSAWSGAVKCAALLGHYDSLTQVLGPAARLAIYRDGLSLLRLQHGARACATELRLAYLDQFEKEGELTLGLHDVDTGLLLAGITFCLPVSQGERLVVIGGLQANPDPRTRGLIHDFAKDFHGMRPKALVLWCLQEIAACWQVAQIQAIDDLHHIYRHRHKLRDFAASYDEFWLESDGQALPWGGWELPLQLRRRSRQELKPNRRRAHELRYALLARLQPLLHRVTAGLSPDGAVATQRPGAPVAFTIGEQAGAAASSEQAAA